MTTLETSPRIRPSPAEARALAERAMRGVGYEAEDAQPFGGHKGHSPALAMHALGVLAHGVADEEATPRQAGAGEIRIPGERAYRERGRRTREGIDIDRRIQDALLRLADGKPGEA